MHIPLPAPGNPAASGDADMGRAFHVHKRAGKGFPWMQGFPRLQQILRVSGSPDLRVRGHEQGRMVRQREGPRHIRAFPHQQRPAAPRAECFRGLPECLCAERFPVAQGPAVPDVHDKLPFRERPGGNIRIIRDGRVIVARIHMSELRIGRDFKSHDTTPFLKRGRNRRTVRPPDFIQRDAAYFL